MGLKKVSQGRLDFVGFHTPLALDEVQLLEQPKFIRKGDYFAKTVVPMGWWLISNKKLEFKRYREGVEYCIPIDDNISITNCKTAIVSLLDVDRESKLPAKTIKITSNIITEYKILKKVYEYYQKPLTKKELEVLSVGDEHYNIKARKALKKEKPLKRIDVMGDLVIYTKLHINTIDDKNGIAYYKFFLAS